MKFPQSQIALYLACALMTLGMFYKPLGLSDTLGEGLQLAALVCGIAYVLLSRKQKARHLDTPLAPVPASRQKARMVLRLSIIVLGSLSAPWWLSFTRPALPFPLRVAIGAFTCIIGVTLYFIGRTLAIRKMRNHERSQSVRE